MRHTPCNVTIWSHSHTTFYIHTALASQCLALVMVLLPHVRAALSAHLQAKQQAFLVELDRIKQVGNVNEDVISCPGKRTDKTDLIFPLYRNIWSTMKRY